MIIMKIIMIAALISAQTPLAGTVSFILLKNNAMTGTLMMKTTATNVTMQSVVTAKQINTVISIQKNAMIITRTTTTTA